jgi:trehalose 6-phosphate phosphatase
MAKFREVGGGGGTLPIYLGDDLTDEDGFKAIERSKGISIFVGGENLQSAANYFLKSPEEVAQFLKML